MFLQHKVKSLDQDMNTVLYVSDIFTIEASIGMRESQQVEHQTILFGFQNRSRAGFAQYLEKRPPGIPELQARMGVDKYPRRE